MKTICLVILLLIPSNIWAQKTKEERERDRADLATADAEARQASIEQVEANEVRFDAYMEEGTPEGLRRAALFLGYMSRFAGTVPESVAAHERALQRILSVPEHASVHIDNFWEKQRAIRDAPDLHGKASAQEDWRRDATSHGIGALPSLESVNQLVEILGTQASFARVDMNEYRLEPVKVHYYDWFPQGALRMLLADPPPQKTHWNDTEEERTGVREAWLAWRDEVRDGKATFRFKGSDQRYNFKGPVDAPTRNLSPRRAAAVARSAAELAAAAVPEGTPDKQPRKGWWVLLIAIIGLATIIVLSSFGMKKSRRRSI